MSKIESILQTLKLLEIRGIRSVPTLVKDLESLINGNEKVFLKNFYKDFLRWNLKLNKFEILNLNKSQKKRLNGLNLMRYEYRWNKSNIKCIFIVIEDNNNDVPVILCAFTEDGDKKKGKKSYNDNIERAISIVEDIG